MRKIYEEAVKAGIAQRTQRQGGIQRKVGGRHRFISEFRYHDCPGDADLYFDDSDYS